MKERPILFSGRMIRAILDGRKTMTRRVVKDNRIDFRGAGGRRGDDWNDPSCWGFETEDGTECALAPGDLIDAVIPCPYGIPGDRLWVRETWAPCIGGPCEPGNPVLYRVDGEPLYNRLVWKPSIFMPRWASRITLELTGVRVERVQEISPEDCISEGIDERTLDPDNIGQYWREEAVATFHHLWDSINAKRGFGWDANPFVWVLTFKRV